MGRAIDMENDIYKLKQEMEKMNNIIRGMADELSEVAEIVLDKNNVEEEKDEKEKTDNKANRKSSKPVSYTHLTLPTKA